MVGLRDKSLAAFDALLPRSAYAMSSGVNARLERIVRANWEFLDAKIRCSPDGAAFTVVSCTCWYPEVREHPAPTLKGSTWVPMERNYDIFKKHPDGMFIWIEATGDLQAAKERPKRLAARSPGEYKVLWQDTRQVVASESGK